jgi:hypothetical protein
MEARCGASAYRSWRLGTEGMALDLPSLRAQYGTIHSSYRLLIDRAVRLLSEALAQSEVPQN